MTEEEYNKLSYMQQEAYLRRCFTCQLKFSPFPISGNRSTEGYWYCEVCWDEQEKEEE